MFANERQDKIYNILQKNGAVTTSSLMEVFSVSIETIRRDLLSMEQQGRLLRVHGGAVAKKDMKSFLNLRERNKEYGMQKQRLAAKAAEFVSNGDIIAVDSGSTAIAFAEILRDRFSDLTVITHSLDVFNTLCDELTVILCGGYYMQSEKTFYGSVTLKTLESIHVKKAFVFPSTVSLEFGICDFQDDLYMVQKQIIKSADEIFILADSSKFEQKALLKLADMNREYNYVTDNELPVEIRKLYKENNIKLYIGGNQK